MGFEKSLENVPKRLVRDFFQTLEGPRTRGPGPGARPEARETFFRFFSGFPARRVRETPVNGQRVPNSQGVVETVVLSNGRFVQRSKTSGFDENRREIPIVHSTHKNKDFAPQAGNRRE